MKTSILFYLICFFSGIIITTLFFYDFVIKKLENEKKKLQELADKHFQLYILMTDWIDKKQKNKSVCDYLKSEGIYKIAIYGINYVGEALINELINSEIEVVIGIDKNADNIFTDIDVVKPEDFEENVDAIIITPIYYYEAIKADLEKQFNCKLISIETIIMEM